MTDGREQPRTFGVRLPLWVTLGVAPTIFFAAYFAFQIWPRRIGDWDASSVVALICLALYVLLLIFDANYREWYGRLFKRMFWPPESQAPSDPHDETP